MLRTIDIHGFRGFQTLRLTGLGRVNLLVGSNNSGKTTVLEAVQFLASAGDVGALVAGLRRRDERASDPLDDQLVSYDVRHLFHGRSLDGSPMRFRATDDRRSGLSFSVAAVPVSPTDEAQQALWRRTVVAAQRRAGAPRPLPQPSLFEDDLDPGARAPRFLVVEAEGADVVTRVALLHGASVTEDDPWLRGGQPPVPVQFVGTPSLTGYHLARLLDRAVLGNELPSAIAALNTVEEGIRQLVAVSDGRSRRIVVGLEGEDEPIPLGSMGDGMSRMLALALSLVAARDGYLLVDEIDTGLHHTVMRKMWRLIFETARRLNVCVYATTHSHDCVRALAEIADPQVRGEGQVALLRIERGAPEAIHFSEQEISMLATREIEPR